MGREQRAQRRRLLWGWHRRDDEHQCGWGPASREKIRRGGRQASKQAGRLVAAGVVATGYLSTHNTAVLAFAPRSRAALLKEASRRDSRSGDASAEPRPTVTLAAAEGAITVSQRRIPPGQTHMCIRGRQSISRGLRAESSLPCATCGDGEIDAQQSSRKRLGCAAHAERREFELGLEERQDRWAAAFEET